MASSITNSLAFSLIFFLCSISIVESSNPITHPTLDRKKTTTHLRIYFHEIIAGENQTSFVVAGPREKYSSGFGEVRVFDSALREGPAPESKLIGRAQGLSVGTNGVGPMSVLVEMNFVLTAGEFNGSTISLFGTIQPVIPVDQAIVGGSGRFRMARGYATRKLVEATASSYVVEFDLYVIDY